MKPEYQDERSKIISELAIRQGKCMLKLRDKICKKEQCKDCQMKKYLDDLKAPLPEYYKFRVADEAECYVEADGKGFHKKMRSLNLDDPKEKIIWEIALRQGKCILKLRDNLCNEEQCKDCQMKKYLDDLKDPLPEYYKFCVDDEAESYVERELQHRKWEGGTDHISDADAKRTKWITIIVCGVFLLLCCVCL